MEGLGRKDTLLDTENVVTGKGNYPRWIYMTKGEMRVIGKTSGYQHAAEWCAPGAKWAAWGGGKNPIWGGILTVTAEPVLRGSLLGGKEGSPVADSEPHNTSSGPSLKANILSPRVCEWVFCKLVSENQPSEGCLWKTHLCMQLAMFSFSIIEI